MQTKLNLPGQKEDTLNKSQDEGLEEFIRIKVLDKRRISSAMRGTDQEKPTPVDADVEEDDVVELEFEGGLRQVVPVKYLSEYVGKQQPQLVSDQSGKREITIPATLGVSDGERGFLKDLFLKTVKVIKAVDIVDEIDDFVKGSVIDKVKDKLITELVQTPTAWAAAVYFEGWGNLYKGKLDPGPGLFRFAEPKTLGLKYAKPGDLKKSNDPFLLFLHGTASSSTGSFGELDRTAQWGEIKRSYGERILAFNHATISQSPIQNAIELVNLLPANSKLHLVSHSRGGLVGEMLSLRPVKGAEMAGLVAPFTKAGRKKDEENLRELVDLLGQKNLQIERFARVACPARGTILASQRIDTYLNALLKAIGYASGWQITPQYNFVKALIMAIVKTKNNEKKMPGLEAMDPASPLIQMINRPGLTSPASLSVIAGDIEGEKLLKNLLVGLSNVFYLEDHDLVVNTNAMYGGIKREKPERFFFDKGSTVSHFSYFKNDLTREKLLNILQDKTDSGFKEIVRSAEPLDISVSFLRDAIDDGKPVVYVLPGIMGSHLKDKDGQVWFDPIQLALGGLGRLAVNGKVQAGAEVKATGLIGRCYQKLVDELQQRYRVIPFPYDWRLSILKAGESLAESVRGVLAEDKKEKRERPIRFIGHSMGGLVVRAMIANHGDLWKEVCSRGGRLVMLGTPNHGSYAIPRMLFGGEKLLKQLALLDFKHDRSELEKIVSAFPGVLELLPGEYLDLASWKKLDGFLPDTTTLKSAKQARDKILKAVDTKNMVYVAGSAAQTPCEIFLDNGKPAFRATPEGDGRVTYELGELEGVERWFMDAEHGDMADYRPAFPAFIDLLETGSTNKLSRTQTVQRGEIVLTTMRDEEQLLFPSEDDLAEAAFGGSPREMRREVHTLRVSVAHGDLRYADNPVAVGHYLGDSIVSAEAVLNRALRDKLLNRFHAGIYPGAAGTSEAIYDPACDPPGALVIGLGNVGDLTTESLQDGVARAALRYALTVLEEKDFKQKSSTSWRPATFSSLLIGTYGGSALDVKDSITSILQGVVIANRTLKMQNLWDRVRIDEVELIEIYEDIAIRAIHAVDDIAKQPPIDLEPDENIELSQDGLVQKEGGRSQQPSNRFVPGWWRRIQITRDENEQVSAAFRGLRFIDLTDRARAEEVTQATQRRLIDNFVAEAIQSYSPVESKKLGLTLFELLWPNTIKNKYTTQSPMLLVLDGDSAQYPWELMVERTNNQPRPLALSKGFIRQFKTREFRIDPQSAHDRNALVIGDTVNNVSPLPFAKQEAAEVSAILKENIGENHVTSLIEAKAKDIMIGLFEKDYNIIHLAGHGLYDPLNPEQSGMVLSDGLTLSTAEIKQLRIVPDLVFINCCHLGRIDRPEESAMNDLKSKLADLMIKEKVLALNAPAFNLASKMIDLGYKFREDQERLKAEILRELSSVGLSDKIDPDKLSMRIVVELVRLSVAQNRHNLFASSISEELIKMGVKAVVAAGWAINDPAAATFARVFYTQMFKGESFGESVLEARQETNKNHPNVNTWGAYQCYGNPEFRLIFSKTWIGSGGDQPRSLSRHEYFDMAQNLVARVKNADAQKRESLKEELVTLQKEMRDNSMGWLDGEMYSSFARAWAELGDYEKAIGQYRLALESETASVTLKDVEQLANLEARWAERLFSEKKSQRAIANARKSFRTSEQYLQRLLDFGKTSERYSMLGSHYKRRAQVSENATERRGMLNLAAENYKKGYELKLKRTEKLDYYPALNYAACKFLIAVEGDKKELIDLIEQARKTAKSGRRAKTEFWDRMAEADATLLATLVSGDLSKEENKKTIIRSYSRAIKVGGSQRELDSVFTQFNFLIKMLEKARKTADVKALKEILGRINSAG